MWVQALGQEDPMCLRAAKPICHNCWAHALEPESHNKRRHHSEQPSDCNWRRASSHHNWRRPSRSNRDLAQPNKGHLQFLLQPEHNMKPVLLTKVQAYIISDYRYNTVPSVCSVAQLCLTLRDPMDCSTPGFLVHHQLPEFTQNHIHWVGDAIQPSHPLSSLSPPVFNLSQHRGLFQWVSSFHWTADLQNLFILFNKLHACWYITPHFPFPQLLTTVTPRFDSVTILDTAY